MQLLNEIEFVKKKMTRFNLALLLVVGIAARPHIPSPMTWMRDQYDARLDTELKEYLGEVLK